MLRCSFRMRSRRQPLSHSQQQPQSEGAFDPRSLASSVRTLLEQHPIFKEPETSDTHRILKKATFDVSINWAISETCIFSLSRSDKIQKKVYSLNLKKFNFIFNYKKHRKINVLVPCRLNRNQHFLMCFFNLLWIQLKPHVLYFCFVCIRP